MKIVYKENTDNEEIKCFKYKKRDIPVIPQIGWTVLLGYSWYEVLNIFFSPDNDLLIVRVDFISKL